MNAFLQRLKPLSRKADLKAYSGLRAQLLWLPHAKPDVAAFASLIGSNTERDYEPQHMEEINEKLVC